MEENPSEPTRHTLYGYIKPIDPISPWIPIFRVQRDILKYLLLGVGTSSIFSFQPEPWRLTPIFQMGWVKTTNRWCFSHRCQSIREPPNLPKSAFPGGHFEGSSLPSFLHGTLLSRATGVGAPGGDSGRGLWWLVWMSPAGVGREVCAVVFSRKSRGLFVLGCFF